MHHKSIRIIFLSYLFVIFTGTALLKLPVATTQGLSLVDALFTATSATCVTGLIVKNTQYDFTLTGQIVIAAMIQIGGFGYMSLVTLLALIVGHKLEFQDRMILKENFNYPTAAGVIRFMQKVFLFVLLIESIGAGLLTARFAADFPLDEALWLGIFHSVSAFNNAGFSIFETGLAPYVGDVTVNLVICTLVVLGGLGFFVLIEVWNRYRRPARTLSMHTKIVLIGTAFLIGTGMMMVFSFEWDNPATLARLGWSERLLGTFFTSINYRTSGFNTIDIGGMEDVTLFFSTLYMMIGGAPGSTAGGIKITTAFVLLLAAYASVRNIPEPSIFKRRVTNETTSKALAILIFSSVYIWLSLVIITETESVAFIKILFEVVSAFATVGLSTGNGGVLSASALFSDVNKVVIILLMLMGRVGVLAFTIVLVGKGMQKRIKYPEGSILL
jgi:trk system potassium uptake protein TrkH